MWFIRTWFIRRNALRLYLGSVSASKWLRTVFTAHPTASAILRKLMPCFLNISISTYTSSVIMAAFKIGHLLKSVYQFSIGALYKFTSGSDTHHHPPPAEALPASPGA